MKDFTRGDYKELVLLVLLYLHDDEAAAEAFTSFCRPGAMHKARWMSKILYAIKIDLLRDHIMAKLPKGSVYGAGQAQKIGRFVKFVIFCYVSWWLTAPVPANAPVNDLALLKGLYSYIDVDEICGRAAFKAFTRHLWYLAEENVLLALFSSAVSEEEKEAMVQVLRESQPLDRPMNRFGNGFGRPMITVLPTPVGPANAQLSTFVGQDSWQFFKLFGIDSGFIETPVCEWPFDERWVKGKLVVNHLSVTNDAAERGVKLAYDYVDLAKKESSYQNILQVVDNQRKCIPNQRRRKKVLAKEWHLRLD